MKVMRFLVVAACLALAPFAADAQTCPNPTPISCGDTISDNSNGGTNNINEYPCLTYTYSGPEMIYLLTLEHGADLEVTLTPGGFWGWDPALIMLPSIGGDCYLSVINGCSDGAGIDVAEGLYGVLPAGDYFIIVDGYLGDSGPFDLSVTCTECVNCADNDSDGFDGSHPTDCPCGTDCNDSDPDRNPAALEICGDTIDQNCDGQDNPCPDPPCNSHLSILCGDSNSADTGNGSAILDDYCASDYNLWDAQEYVFSITPQTDGVIDFTATNMGGEQLDAFAFRSFGVVGICNKDSCLDVSSLTTGTQRLAFFGEAGETYFISVDGRNNARGPFDYTVACRAEECTAGSAILCGDDISGDTTGDTNTVSAYQGLGWHLLGPEDVYSFTVASNDAEVAVTLQIDAAGTPPDLALLIVEDDGNGACLPDHAIMVSDLIQEQGSNPPEFLTFSATAGATYFVVVEGAEADDFGSYNLRVDCAVQCAPGETDCAGTCVDTNTNVSHCGTCGNACQFAHAAASCAAGSCVMGACDTGWENCDGDPVNGCEADLTSTATCGACDNACQFDHATATCDAGSCVMGGCDANWGDCDGDPLTGCETDLSNDDLNCGACALACTAPEFCSQGVCGVTCPGGLVRCGGVCVDTNTDLNHCGACDNACTVANGTPACVAGNCTVGSCDAGFGDCDSAYANGCETALGTDLNCSRCGETCTFTHASGSCVAGSCVMGNCDTGWGDCDLNPATGCEADLTSEQTCGNCNTSCQANESCQNGQCIFYCADDDGDGYQDANCGGTDCNDGNDTIYPGAPDTCGDGVDQNCDGTDECICADADLDGHQDQTCGGDDCDDNNGQIHPQAQEICNDNQDNDCDSLTDCTDTDCVVDPGCTCPDADGDKHHAFNCGGNDCDDSRFDVHPGAIEICGDGIDQDCDGKDRSCGEDSGCGCNSAAGSAAPAFLFGLMMLLGMLRRKF
ncbi:MopE-related protein [Myxococcota bacterium]